MFRQWLTALKDDDSGVTIVEYSVLITLIVLIAFHSMRLCGFEVAQFFQFAASELDSFLT